MSNSATLEMCFDSANPTLVNPETAMDELKYFVRRFAERYGLRGLRAWI